ncbi:interferon alpha-inducible protein 27-like protein 2A isoform X2 [Watersipora subatra]|uniref:interferon alpha-inducible protein 27-like protein 2A isoform X2 n=1 Tax=Watersipora subatra TaxID=2589382 RepID=UPI00355B4931
MLQRELSISMDIGMTRIDSDALLKKGAVGFTAGGVAAGSIAAAIQSVIGNVAAGSVFAALQSAGAVGIAGAATAGAAATATVGAGAAVAGALIQTDSNPPTKID